MPVGSMLTEGASWVWGLEKLRPGLGSATNPEPVLPPRNLKPMAAYLPFWASVSSSVRLAIDKDRGYESLLKGTG